MQVFQDEFSNITYDDTKGILTLNWTENTANMTDEDFKKVNLAYAEAAEQYGAQRLLVDVENFKHTWSDDVDTWRQQTIIPKYHNAGVTRFAFVHGAGFEEPPAGPQKNEGEYYLTGHIGSKVKAEAWLLEA